MFELARGTREMPRMKRETLVEAYVTIAEELRNAFPQPRSEYTPPVALPRGRHLSETQPIPCFPRPGDVIWQRLEPAAVAEIAEYLASDSAEVLPQ